MHKGVILLTKALDGKEAETKINSFMEEFEGKVWDWFRIGGRWGFDETGTNILPLSECINMVNEWHQDPEKEYEKQLKEAEQYYGTGAKHTSRKMYGFCLMAAAKHLTEDFNFNCNVYNTEEMDYSIPANLTGWYAVMVDMHF